MLGGTFFNRFRLNVVIDVHSSVRSPSVAGGGEAGRMGGVAIAVVDVIDFSRLLVSDGGFTGMGS